MDNHLGRIAVAVAAVLVAVPAIGAIPDSERDALIAIYDATGGPGWNNSGGWLGAVGSECTWHGVDCGGGPSDQYVEGLHLTNNNLIGVLPLEVGDLPGLRELSIAWNQIGGPLPAELGNLLNLENLYAQVNEMSGTVPAALGNLTHLVTLRLANNRLTGPIPPELGNLNNLELLWLDDNRLTGPIPPEIGNLSHLRDLHLSANQLEGPIPSEFVDFTGLACLRLDNNRLTGAIPPGFSNLEHLRTLALNSNLLSEAIPVDLGSSGSLGVIDLSDNQLSGPIPPGLGSTGFLEALYLSGNRLTGPIPAELGQPTNNLVVLFLDNNRLTGPIPSQLGSLPHLDQLVLAGNRLSGPIPSEIGNLSLLWNLDLSRNCLEGALPPELGTLNALEVLHLSGNRFVGEIPSQITHLTKLGDGGSTIDFNGVHTGDPGVAAFMDAKFGGGWRDRQTVPPEYLTVEWVTGLSTGLTWDPIPYQSDEGGYVVMVATDAGGPYETSARTLGKHLRRWPIYDLAASSTYYVKVCTVTEPHPANQNTVVSELTAPLTVTTTGDPSTWYVATTGAPSNDCATPGTPCASVQDAHDRSAPGEQIFVAPGIYHESLGIGHPIRIIGDGAATTVIDAGDSSTVIWVGWGQNLRMSALTLRNGTNNLGGGVYVAPFGVFDFTDGVIADSHAISLGGGLFVDHEGGARLERVAVVNNTAGENGGGVGSAWGTHVLIADSTVSGNHAPWGGGLHLSGNSIIERTTVDGNTADSFGGGGIATEGMMFVSDSAVTNNSAAHGGGIANLGGGGYLEVENSTISGNTGGGLFNDRWGRTDVESCTITDNSAPFTEHSGLMNWNELYLHNTIISGNSPFNCANPITSRGYNLDDDATCGLEATGDISDVEPLLGPLADNGGPTLTHALPLDSPAIDAGDPLDYPPTDQRGYDRPSDGISAPDIGAYENTDNVFTDGFESGDLTRWSAAVP